MMRSMYSGVSGLKNHQTRMDVIGNNIANVNTVGYKKSRLVFKDTLYQTIRGSSGASESRGGTNSMAIGLGMKVGTVDQIHTAAPATTTNNLTDMAVDGNGYFILSNAGTKTYTRAGAFSFDEQGNLVNSSDGYFVLGWNADAEGVIDATSEPAAIDLSTKKSIAPVMTTEMEWTGNLNSDADVLMPSNVDPTGYTVFSNSKEFYDNLGNKRMVYFRYDKIDVRDGVAVGTTTQNGTIWRIRASLDSTCPNPTDGTVTPNTTTDYYAFFDEDGKLVAVHESLDTEEGRNPTSAAWVPPGGMPTTQELSDGAYVFAATDVKTTANFNIAYEDEGVPNTQTIALDLGEITQYQGSNTAWAESQNGNAQGSLTSYSIGIDGVIQGVYDNGQVTNLARVALATFQNPAGLIQVGSNQFQVSNNSGDANVGPPGEQGFGAIIPGALEMSNVDLSEEFTDMITTQRGFQANSRVITTSDEMLQELVNLKR